MLKHTFSFRNRVTAGVREQYLHSGVPGVSFNMVDVSLLKIMISIRGLSPSLSNLFLGNPSPQQNGGKRL